MNDPKFALRMLCKNPGFTAVSLLTLAFGIGATTAIYSVVHAVVLDPIPDLDSERLVQVNEIQIERQWESGLSGVLFQELEDQEEVFADLAGYERDSGTIQGDELAEQIWGAKVSLKFFDFFKADAARGRTFLPEDGEVKNAPVLVISHLFWQRHFGGASDVIGRTLKLDDRSYTVIGVMPAAFQYPLRGNACNYWRPTDIEPLKVRGMDPRMHRYWRTVARLHSDATMESSQAAMDAMFGRLAGQFPETCKNWIIRVPPLSHSFSDEDIRQTSWGLLMAIVFVLLIGSANVANLMLARAETRRQEIAVRMAHGASRLRLVRLVLTECLIISLIAGGLGLLIAHWGIILLDRNFDDITPLMREVRLNQGVFLFALALSSLTGIGFGLAPAWKVSQLRLVDALKTGNTSATSAAERKWFSRSFVVAEIALAFILLIGAGLMLTSVSRLMAVDPGFNTKDLTWVNVTAGKDYDSNRIRTVLNELLDQFQSIPMVDSVALRASGGVSDYVMEGQPKALRLHSAKVSAGEHDYFRTIQVPLLAGRTFAPEDSVKGVGNVIINESMAEQCWPGENAVGKRFQRTANPNPAQNIDRQWHQVVGVVRDTRLAYERKSAPTFYAPVQNLPGRSGSMLIRSASDLAALAPAIRARMAAVDKTLPVPQIHAVEQMLVASTEPRRTYMFLLSGFAAVGVLLALMGIYGVTAYTVARRSREIGLRMALGARKSDILKLVLSQGSWMIAAGLALGCLGAMATTRLMSNLLFGVSATDPVTFASLGALMAVITLAACFSPARRASNTQPAEALRYE